MESKDEGRKGVLFMLAGLLYALDGAAREPKRAFDQAEQFLAEAEARGLNPAKGPDQ